MDEEDLVTFLNNKLPLPPKERVELTTDTKITDGADVMNKHTYADVLMKNMISSTKTNESHS